MFSVAVTTHWNLRLLDLDLHHDGYVAAIAIAVSSGATPHLDVFTQYGASFAWLQALTSVGGQVSVLRLRSLHVALIGVTAALLVLTGRRNADSDWPIRQSAASVASLTYVGLSSNLTWVPMLPWVSVFVAAALVGAVVALRVATEAKSRTVRRLSSVFAALLTLVAATSRPAVGIIAVALLSVVVLINPVVRNVVGDYTVALAFGLLILLGATLFSRWGNYFVRDMLTWPIEKYIVSGYSHPEGSIGLLVGALPVLMPLLVFVAILCVHAGRFVSSLPADLALAACAVLTLSQADAYITLLTVSVGLVAILVVIVSALVQRGQLKPMSPLPLTIYGSAVLVMGPITRKSGPGFHPSRHVELEAQLRHVLLSHVTTSLLYAFVIGALLVAIGVVATVWLSAMHVDARFVILSVFVIASFGELASFSDTHHVWWMSPLSLLLIFSQILRGPDAVSRIALAAAFSAAILLAAFSSSQTFLAVERVHLSQGIGAGMNVGKSVAVMYENQTEMAKDSLDGPWRFFVTDAYIVAASDARDFKQRTFVAWGPDLYLGNLIGSPVIVVQASLATESVIRELSDSGYSLHGFADSMLLFRR